MKQLFLLRHATAMPSSGGGDKERKLAHEGLIEAAALGVEMVKRHYHPAYVLCSPALRTRETYAQLPFDAVPHEFPEGLYNSGARDLLAHIHAVDDKNSSVLVIAHNPGIYELAASLCASGESSMHNQLMNGFRPCTLAVMSCKAKSWKDVKFNDNELKDFLESRAY